MLRRIFEVDPLLCPRCGGAMRIIAFLTEPAVISGPLSVPRRTACGDRCGARRFPRAPAAPRRCSGHRDSLSYSGARPVFERAFRQGMPLPYRFNSMTHTSLSHAASVKKTR